MKKTFLGVGLVLVLAGLLVAGCSSLQHQEAASAATQVQLTAEQVKGIVGGETAKVVAGVLSGLPTPVAPIVEPARSGIEWGAGIVASLAGLVAAWQTKKARDEKSKKRTYKAVLSKDQLDAANKAIFGSAFKADLSK